MPHAGYLKIVSKSRAACIAAVEIYNRTVVQYREETFAILMVNAWELLLKARIIQENMGKHSSLYEYQYRKKKDGSKSKFKDLKLTRSGSPMTIGLDHCCNIVAGYANNRIDVACIKNLQALVEVRDNATHFINQDIAIRKVVTEVSLGSVKNYVIAIQKWFNVSFSDLNISLIPISFELDQDGIEAVAKKPAVAVSRFLAHMQSMKQEAHAFESEYAFSVRVEFDLIKNKADGAVKATLVRDDADLTLGVDDDRVPAGFTWDYKTLTDRLVERYDNFSQNPLYHKIRKTLEGNKKFCFVRYLDPKKKSSSIKRFYNPNIIQEFDKSYVKRGSTLFDNPQTTAKA